MSTSQGFGKQETKKGQSPKVQPEQKARQENKPSQLQNVLSLMKSGAKLSDLSPEQIKELSETAGNQAVLELFGNGSAELLLAKLPEEQEGDASGLPVNEVEIRWPALFPLPEMQQEETGSKKNAWPVEQIRPMGAYEGGPYLC